MKHFQPPAVSDQNLAFSAPRLSTGSSQPGRYRRERPHRIPAHSWLAMMQWMLDHPEHYISEPDSRCVVYIGHHHIYQMDRRSARISTIPFVR